MGVINALKTGNHNDPTVWPDEIIPGASDDVHANGYTITINANWTVASLRTTAGGGGVAGGKFTPNSGVVITGHVYAGTAYGIEALYPFTLVGNAYGSDTHSTAGVFFSGSGTVLIIGNAVAGLLGYGAYAYSISSKISLIGNPLPSSGANGLYAYYGSADVTGTVTGGASAVAAIAGHQSQNAGLFRIYGNVSGGTIAGAHGIFSGVAGRVEIYGIAEGGVHGAYAVQSFNVANTCKVYSLKFGASGQSPIAGQVQFMVQPSSVVDIYTDSGQRNSCLPSPYICSLPSITDVRSGVQYDYNTKTGTCAVPASGSVALGVPVDATTGTAVLTPQAVWEYTTRTLTAGGLSAQEIWEYVTRTLTENLSQEEIIAAVHSALDTWEKPTTPPIPPIVLPPDNPDLCRLSLFVAPDPITEEYPETVDLTCKLTQLPFEKSQRYWPGKETDSVYDADTGEASWLVPQGCTVTILSVDYSMKNKQVVVPLLATHIIEEI
jgi:hypothetical protein